MFSEIANMSGLKVSKIQIGGPMKVLTKRSALRASLFSIRPSELRTEKSISKLRRFLKSFFNKKVREIECLLTKNLLVSQ